MSEKRFSLKEWEDLNYCEHCFYDGESQLSDDDVVVLLNEQQSTIRKLQDLCGKSDGENMKLRNEIKLLKPTNIEQYEQIVQLQEENERLNGLLFGTPKEAIE